MCPQIPPYLPQKSNTLPLTRITTPSTQKSGSNTLSGRSREVSNALATPLPANDGRDSALGSSPKPSTPSPTGTMNGFESEIQNIAPTGSLVANSQMGTSPLPFLTKPNTATNSSESTHDKLEIAAGFYEIDPQNASITLINEVGSEVLKPLIESFDPTNLKYKDVEYTSDHKPGESNTFFLHFTYTDRDLNLEYTIQCSPPENPSDAPSELSLIETSSDTRIPLDASNDLSLPSKEDPKETLPEEADLIPPKTNTHRNSGHYGFDITAPNNLSEEGPFGFEEGPFGFED